MRTAKARIFNLSFGQVSPGGIRFAWRSQRLSELVGEDVRFQASLTNDPETFAQETELVAYHSLPNKQDLGHNHRAPFQTGWINVDYQDFDAELTGRFVEDGNIYLCEVVAPILSFFQRRRILITRVKFTSSQRLVIALPMFLAGEWVDSVAFGPETIRSSELEPALNTALAVQGSMDEVRRHRLGMLLSRYNELLNLPYIHERSESLWRIVEAIGRIVPASQTADAEYQRFLKLCKIRKSENLELLIAALTHYAISYTDDEVCNSRAFRNHAMHEYLDPNLQSWPSLVQVFYFLQRCVDKIVSTDLGVSGLAIQGASYAVIQNRVL